MTSPKHHPHPHHQPKPAAQPAPAPEPKDLPPIKSWAYPFATNSGKSPPDAQDYLQALGVAGDGFYPLGASGIWHGGIHFDQQTDGMLKQGDGVRAIADGEVVAYRLDSKYVELNYSDGRKARYSTGFVLVHHKLALPPMPDPSKTSSNDAAKPPPSDEVLDFYSLYMHQSDWASYQEAEKSTPPPADPAKPPTPAVQRMPFWQGNAYYRVGSKANDKQNPATGSPNPVAPDAAPAANAPLAVGLHIHDKAKGKILGLLPQGTELTVSATSTPGWVTIASISKGAPVGDMQGTDPQPGASNGWVFLDDLDSLIDPSPLDAVVALTKPFRVKAGDLLGYVGQYVRHGDASVLPAASTSRPLLHLEVFAGDAFPAFLDKSRERAKKLPDGQNTLLVVSPGAALVDVSQPVDQKVAIGLTLEPVADNPGSGRWTKVQPTKIVKAQATHLNPHPATTRSKEGDPFWVERSQSGDVVAGVVNGWKAFPLQLSNPKLATASFMDVFAPAELTRLDADAKAVDDQGVPWWKIEVGTGKGESGSGWVCGKGHPQTAWQSPWAWPGFEVVDGTTVSMADVFKRSIVVNGLALPDEESSFQPSAVTVNGSELLTKLEKAIDLDGNGMVTAQELATAHSTSWLAEALSHLVVRYESEWGGDMSKWSALTPLMKERAPIWQDELQRIQKLQWWDQVKAVKDFPAGPTVYHFHPIGLIGNFAGDPCKCGCCYEDKFQVTRMGTHYGPVYWGDTPLEKATVFTEMVSGGDISESEHRILVAMSANEGKIDSVQSYDSEVLTAGAMQKTINSSGKGEFPTQVAKFRSDSEADYIDLFEQCGWTVEGTGSSAVMYYSHATLTGDQKITGDGLKQLIRQGCSESNYKKSIKNIPLSSIVHAISAKSYEKRQLMDFIDRLRNNVLPTIPANYSYPVSSYFKSDLGRATALDQSVNRPANVGRDIGAALDRFFARHPTVSRNPGDWGDNQGTYEHEILEIYGPSRDMAVIQGVSAAPARYSALKAKLT
jgi:hypothetical protein